MRGWAGTRPRPVARRLLELAARWVLALLAELAEEVAAAAVGGGHTGWCGLLQSCELRVKGVCVAASAKSYLTLVSTRHELNRNQRCSVTGGYGQASPHPHTRRGHQQTHRARRSSLE